MSKEKEQGERGSTRALRSLQTLPSGGMAKNVKPVVLCFSFLRNKPTNITNMSLPKLISNVILICALVCVWAGFRALHQFAVLLLCSDSQLCHGGLVREKGVEEKDLK